MISVASWQVAQPGRPEGSPPVVEVTLWRGLDVRVGVAYEQHPSERVLTVSVPFLAVTVWALRPGRMVATPTRSPEAT